MRSIAIAILCTVLGAASAEEIKLPITADSSISMHPSETGLNAGKSTHVKMKGIENVIICDADLARLTGKVVDKAVLHIRGTADDLMVRKVGLSTIATPWNEGVAGGGEGSAAKKGDSCFVAAVMGDNDQPERLWGGLGSCFLDAVFGRGGTIWTEVYVEKGADQWYAIPVDGRLLEACASGLSSGLAFSDENGQTMNIHDPAQGGNHSNNFFFSHEQNASAPYLVVTASPTPAKQAMAIEVTVKPWPGGADLSMGGIEVSWAGPKTEAEGKSIIGYCMRCVVDGKKTDLPRWQHPSPPPVGEAARAMLRAQSPGSTLDLEIEAIGRGGVVIATGKGKGVASPAYPAVKALELPSLPAPAAGAPPEDANGVVWVAPDLVKINPITGNLLEEGGYEADAKGTSSQANRVWSGANHTISVSALRNEWVAFQIVCQNKRDAGAWTITPGALSGPDGAKLPASALRLSRLWYQKVGGERGWYADPMLPLASGGKFSIPDQKNSVTHQANQTIYAELFVPKDAKAGTYIGEIAVSSGDGKPITLAVELTVGAAALHDDTAFVWSMNAYSSPGNDYGKADSEAFRAAERSFYVVAHEHRTTLAWLGYGHSAHFQDGVTWPLTGSGKDMKVSDWKDWDERFGPLFDGSAFKGTSRQGVALDHFYLPFMESWPTPITDYKWNASTWEEHWKVAGAIEDGFSQKYKDQWVAVMKDFIAHVQERNYRTKFQVYLNDKYFYKQYNKRNKSADHRGQGTSFWLLDEPQQIDDFLALEFFGKLTREAQQGNRSVVLYRGDISRPQYSRDTLDRVIDLDVSGAFDQYRTLIEDWHELHGQVAWTYGGAPSSLSSALGLDAQALDLYRRGVQGFVPWLVLGDEKNWGQFADTCVIYTGKPMGIVGACASLRLKGYRRGEQDVEYVRLLGEKLNLFANDPGHRQIDALLGSSIAVTKNVQPLDAQGAKFTSFSGLHDEDFERLRRGIAMALP